MPRTPAELQRLERIQVNRGRPARDDSIGNVVAKAAAEAERAQRRVGQIAELWESIVPAEIAEHTALIGLQRGVLSVTVDSSAAGFELDRFLRAGGEAELRRRYRGSLVRIRARLRAPAAPPTAPTSPSARFATKPRQSAGGPPPRVPATLRAQP